MQESSITVFSPNERDERKMFSTREEMLSLAGQLPFNFYIDGKNRLKFDIDTPNHQGSVFVEPGIIYLGSMPIRSILSQSFGIEKNNRALLSETMLRVLEVNSEMKFGSWVMDEGEGEYFFRVCIQAPLELEHHMSRFLVLAATVFFHLYDELYQNDTKEDE